METNTSKYRRNELRLETILSRMSRPTYNAQALTVRRDPPTSSQETSEGKFRCLFLKTLLSWPHVRVGWKTFGVSIHLPCGTDQSGDPTSFD